MITMYEQENSVNISSIASAANNMNAAGIQYMASLKVMNMAQDVFTDVAEELIDAMNSVITGLGQNVDITV